jgi:hypothetical protein
VFVHRDPVKVLLSQARLTEVLRKPFTRTLDRRELGKTESRRWLDGTKRMMEAADNAGFTADVCHVHHMDLISDPVSTVEGVYRHFGIDFPATASAGIENYVAARPRGGYGERSYRFEDHGLDEQQERDRFRPYMLRFGVTAELAQAHQSAVPSERVAKADERTLQI